MKDIVKKITETVSTKWEFDSPLYKNPDMMLINVEDHYVELMTKKDIKEADYLSNSDDQSIYPHIKDLKFGESFEDSVNIWVCIK